MIGAHKLWLVAVVAGVATLGNLRSEASETATTPARLRAAAAVAPVAPRMAMDEHLHDDVAFVQSDVDEAGSPVGPLAEPAELVPALYARNPEIRFVYDHRVSRWM